MTDLKETETELETKFDIIMSDNSSTQDQYKTRSLMEDTNTNNHQVISGNGSATDSKHYEDYKDEKRILEVKLLDLDEERTIEIEEDESAKKLIYRVRQTPPPHLLFLFSMQQALLSIASPLTVSLIVAEISCAQQDDAIKTQILSATMFMAGFSTIIMTTVGVRLPIFQGPSSAYLVPLLALQTLDEWKCPKTFMDPNSNSTELLVMVGNSTIITARELTLEKIGVLSGSLIAAGALHAIIGTTGLVGVLIRYIGPVTIVPTIVLVGLYIYKLAVKFSETSWLVSSTTAGMAIFLSIGLANRKTPLPAWSKSKGFHIFWFPLHQVFALLISMSIGWAFSGVLTKVGFFSDDPTSKNFLARTDSRSYVIDETDWFIFSYPGKFGSIRFSVGAFINFFLATLLSILDSIGDYNASARVAQVAPPPSFAFNRGIGVEGIMSVLSGSMGCCHATVSYGGNIGAMGITRVVSRSVFVGVGLVYIVFSVLGKIGAVFITIPHCVLGGSQILTFGIFVGVILSYLQTIDLNSTRNLAIIGIALLLGLMLPYWVKNNPSGIDVGHSEVNNVIKMLLSNPSFVGGVFAMFMDNAVPGTLKERGLDAQMKELNDEDAKEEAKKFEDGIEVYRLPFVPDSFRKSRYAKYFPFVQNLHQ